MGATNNEVALEPKIAEEIGQSAGAANPSRYVNDVLRQHLQAIRIRKLLDEMAEEVGPIPEEAQREVNALSWPGLPARPRQQLP